MLIRCPGISPPFRCQTTQHILRHFYGEEELGCLARGRVPRSNAVCLRSFQNEALDILVKKLLKKLCKVKCFLCINFFQKNKETKSLIVSLIFFFKIFFKLKFNERS